MRKYLLIVTVFISMLLPMPIDATTHSLEIKIEQILADNNTTAASIAVIEENGNHYVFGVGITNEISKKPVDANTLFRIGSISKIFTSLSILKLVEEKQLSLQDEVRKWADEVEFYNPWEDEYPVKIVHLLSHTAGWNDLHMSEYAHNDELPIALIDAFKVYPKTRTSRWVPGTRYSYSNDGPGIAAYIVEKRTNQSYEEYVDDIFFKPLHMNTATFFKPDDYIENSATLYSKEIQQPYWNLIMRPSGAINASANDMIKLLNFFVNADEQEILSVSSIERMRELQDSTIATSGLEAGSSLSQFIDIKNGFTWYGHDGGVNGGLSNFKYMPEFGVGYYVAINSDNGNAIMAITELLESHLTENIEPSYQSYSMDKTVDSEVLSGYYRAINPRNQSMYFLEYLTSIIKIEAQQEGITLFADLGASIVEYIPINKTQYVDPVSGKIMLTITEDPLAGKVVQTPRYTLQPISTIAVFGPLLFIILWLLVSIVVLVRPIFLLILKAFRKQTKINLWTHLLPVLQILSFAFFISGFVGLVVADPLGDNNFISGVMAYSTVLFLMLSLGSVIWFTVRKEKHYGFFQGLLYSIMNLGIGIYLTVMGITGFHFY